MGLVVGNLNCSVLHKANDRYLSHQLEEEVKIEDFII